MTDKDVGEQGVEFGKFMSALERRFGDKIVASWMSDLKLEKMTPDSVTFSTESQIKCDTIGQRFIVLMREIWCEEVGPVGRLQIVMRRRLSDGAARVNALKPAHGAVNGHAAPMSKNARRAAGDISANGKAKDGEAALDYLLLPIDAQATFDRFAVADSNRIALAAAQQVFAEDAPSPLTYLYGPSGVGKSHLLYGIGNEHKRRHGPGGCAYITYNAMQSGCVSAVFSNSMMALHQELLRHDVVLIDDIHQLLTSPRTQKEILNLINAFLATGRRLVIAGELSPAKLAKEGMNPSLTDRLAGGLSVGLRPATAALRARVLRLRLEAQPPKCKITDAAIDFVAENFTNSMREAIGGLNQLMLAYGQDEKSVVGIDEAKAALHAHLSEGGRRPPTLEEAVAATAAAYGVSVEEIKGRGQEQRLARARHAYSIVCREYLRESFPRIAKTINRDHTTIMSGYRRGHALLERDKQFQSAMAALREKIGAPPL